MPKNLLFKLLIVLAILSALIAGSFVLYDYIKTQEKFPLKTFIGYVDVSGLTANEAALKLSQSEIEDLLPGSIIFYASKETFSFSPRDLGVYVLGQDTVSQAFRYAHQNGYFVNLTDRIKGKYMVLPAKFSFVPEKAQEIILEIGEQVNSPAVNATIKLDEKTGGYHISPDRSGRKLKVAESLLNFKKSLEKGQLVSSLAIEQLEPPKITEKDLRTFPPVNRISAYTTYYGAHDSPNRIHNIKLIASWLDNTLMLPGEELSLTNKIGDFTAERGFLEAYVIINKELVPELGGGTCQIGTTLFNAVALADLDVLSRRNHSFYFNIYPLGRDATIYPGSADFKFKNSSGHSILIKAVATNSKLSFRIYGTPSGNKVEFSKPEILMYSTQEAAFRPATLRTIIANDLPFRTIVKRTVTDKNGKPIKEETIRSYYKLYGDKANVPIKRAEPR